MNKLWFMPVVFFVLLSGFGVVTVQAQWEPDQRLTFDPGASQLSFNFVWSIVADDFGRVHVVWYDTRDGIEQIYYKHSSDGGTSWAVDIHLSEVSAGQEHPAVAVSGSYVYVVWHDARNGNLDIYLKRSTYGGATWEPDMQLTSHLGSSAHASIAASGSNVHAVWMDNRDGQTEIYTRRSTDGGATWVEEMRLSDVPFESWVPTVAVSGGSVYVAWVDYRDANEEEYFRRSADGGVTWGPVTRLTDNPADSWAPSIAISGDTVHVTWFDRRDAGVMDSDVEEKLDEAMALLGLPVEPAPPRDPSVYYLPLFEQRVQDKLQKIQAAGPGWVKGGGNPQTLEAILKEFERLMKLWTTGWEIYYKRSTDSGDTWGADTRLTNAVEVSLRPSIAVSGRNLHIVWFDARDGNPEIYYKHSLDGGATWGPDVRLTNALGDSRHPTVALSSNAVHVVWFDQRDGNAEIYYKRNLSTPDSLGNRLIVYVGPDTNGQGQIFTIMPDGSNKRQLTQTAGGNSFPAWSHDGKRIAFTSGRSGTPELWMMDADGSNQTQLTTPPGSGNFVPSWSPDATQIAFSSIRTSHPEIWVMNADGSNQRQLTTTATPGGSNAPSWSPDGTKIAFASDRSGSTQVYTMNPDGSDVQQLTEPIEPNFPDSNVPVWSPDGSKIAFWSGIEQQFGQVWVMDADGSNRRPLTNCSPPSNCDNPAWSPAGTVILFETNRDGPIETWIMDADGSNQRRLFPFPYGAGRLPWQPVRQPITGVEDNTDKAPQGFQLNQNYPNPFNPTTTIRFSLPGRSRATLKVFDVLGRKVATLVDGVLNRDTYSVLFDARRLASGVYFYQLQAGNFVMTKKLLLLR